MEKYERKSDDSDDNSFQDDDLSFHSALSEPEDNFFPMGEPKAEPQEEVRKEEKRSGNKLVIDPDEPRPEAPRKKEGTKRRNGPPRREYKYQKKGEGSKPVYSTTKEMSYPDDELQLPYKNQAPEELGKRKPKKEQIRYVRKEKKPEELGQNLALPYNESDLIEPIEELKLVPKKYNRKNKSSTKYVKKSTQYEEEQFTKIPDEVPVERHRQKVEPKKKNKQQSSLLNQAEKQVKYRKKEAYYSENTKGKLNVEAHSFAYHHAPVAEGEKDNGKLSTDAPPFQPKKKSNSPTGKAMGIPAMYGNAVTQSGLPPMQFMGVPFQIPATSYQSSSMMPGYSINYSAYPY